MSFAFPARKRALITIALSTALFLSLLFSVPLEAAVSDWNSVSNEQIARLFFHKGKLGFRDSTEGLVDEDRSIDGVLVYEVKRVIANFDNDPETEMAVLIVYSESYAYAEYTEAIFAILDIENEEIKIRWRTEEGEAFANAPLDISAIRLINKDRFFALACTYDSSPFGRGSSNQKTKIIRWDGEKFSEIWSYNLRSYDVGNRGGLPHDYLAKVDFVDGKNAKRIKVDAIFTAHGREEEVHKKEYKLKEEFVWKEKDQKYARVGERKRTPLTLLRVYRGMELPSSPEFTSSRVRSISPRGVDEEGKHEVVIFAEMEDAKGKSQNFTSVLKIDLQSGTLSQSKNAEQALIPSSGARYQGRFCYFGFSAGAYSCTIYVTLKDYRRMISVNSDEWSPKAATVDYRNGGHIDKMFLLDDKAFLFINRAALFVLTDETPAVAVFGTRIPNPILEELNEYGLFLYVWDSQNFVLRGKFSFPNKINVSSIEAFTLLTSEITKSYRPAGILALEEGSYRRALYIFK